MNKQNFPPLSEEAQSVIVGGIYEHYKKLHYKVLAIAHHSESLEEFVVYQALYGEGAVWVRLLGMFVEQLLINGQLQPRFTYLSDGV